MRLSTEKLGLAVVLFAMAGLFLLVGKRPAGDEPARTGPLEEGEAPRSARTPGADRIGDSTDPLDLQRSQDLQKLKDRWAALDGGNDKMEEREALSKESARLLMCSKQAVELLGFLDERRIYNTVSYHVEELFRSPISAEARAMLVSLPDSPAAGGTNYREEWSEEAGRHCPKDEFEAFRTSLGTGACGQEATFGYNQTLMTSDPAAAIASTLAELQKNIPSKSRRSCLKSQMEQLPANADFKALESLLPAVDVNKNEDPVNVSRSVLFEKWAASDPAGAANHVIENPSRFNPRLIRPIADVVLRNDPSVGWEWVQEFPDGPYFDTAASIAIDYMREFHPDQAKRLAEGIGDPQMRKRAIARAAAPIQETGN